MAVNEHRPAVADVKFDVKEGSSICSATFIFGYVRNLNLAALLLSSPCYVGRGAWMPACTAHSTD